MPGKITVENAVIRYEVTERTIHRAIKENNVTRYNEGFDIFYDADELHQAIRGKFVDRSPLYSGKAKCRGLKTNLFFMEDDTLRHKGLEFTQVRAICFSCPLRKECLEIAYQTGEEYGMMGGVSGNERRQILAKNYNGKFMGPLKRDLERFGVDFSEVLPEEIHA